MSESRSWDFSQRRNCDDERQRKAKAEMKKSVNFIVTHFASI